MSSWSYIDFHSALVLQKARNPLRCTFFFDLYNAETRKQRIIMRRLFRERICPFVASGIENYPKWPKTKSYSTLVFAIWICDTHTHAGDLYLRTLKSTYLRILKQFYLFCHCIIFFSFFSINISKRLYVISLIKWWNFIISHLNFYIFI